MTTDITQWLRRLASPRRPQAHGSGGRRAAALLLRLSCVALLAWIGAVHLHLWLEGYRQIPTDGPLFLLDAVTGLVLADKHGSGLRDRSGDHERCCVNSQYSRTGTPWPGSTGWKDCWRTAPRRERSARSWATDRLIRITSVVAVATVAAVASGHLIPLRRRVGELYGETNPRTSAGSLAGGWRCV
jgi:hypothetical protein